MGLKSFILVILMSYYVYYNVYYSDKIFSTEFSKIMTFLLLQVLFLFRMLYCLIE